MRKARILVVDDERAISEILACGLGAAGHAVTAVENADAAATELSAQRTTWSCSTTS